MGQLWSETQGEPPIGWGPWDLSWEQLVGLLFCEDFESSHEEGASWGPGSPRPPRLGSRAEPHGSSGGLFLRSGFHPPGPSAERRPRRPCWS